MDVVRMEEAKLVVVDDLDFGIKDVAFEVKVFNSMTPLIELQIEACKIQAMHVFHCDLLDMAALITLILKVKSLYIKMHEQHLHKCMFVMVENFGIESKSKRGFEKGDMHVAIIIELTTIVFSILTFQLESIPFFSHGFH